MSKMPERICIKTMKKKELINTIRKDVECVTCEKRKKCMLAHSLKTFEGIVGYSLECWTRKGKSPSYTGLHSPEVEKFGLGDFEFSMTIWAHRTNPQLSIFMEENLDN